MLVAGVAALRVGAGLFARSGLETAVGLDAYAPRGLAPAPAPPSRGGSHLDATTGERLGARRWCWPSCNAEGPADCSG